MKEFLKSNTITYNLMSFTGFKDIQLFSLLLEEPKSYLEMQEYLKTQEYMPEDISVDTLRIYINTLRKMGCDIKRKSIYGVTKYYIEDHPFQLKVTETQVKSIIKLYKAIANSVSVTDLVSLQMFFNSLAEHITNESLKAKLKNLSPIKNIEPKMIKDLIYYAKKNYEISVLYNSNTDKTKNITIVVDKLYVANNKLYISGVSSEHNNYSAFPVSKIIKISSVNINAKTLSVPEIIVGYEYQKDDSTEFELLPNEIITRNYKTKLVIEITSKNKFELMQRILSLSPRAKVLYPADFKDYIITNLKKMKEGYFVGK